MPRKRPTRTEKLAAVLLMLKRGDGSWLIPEPRRSGSAEEICAAVEWHHEHPVALGGTNDPHMLTPMAPEDHGEVTAKIDMPRIAKTKRLRRKEEQFRRRLLDHSGQGELDTGDKPKRKCSFPGGRESPWKKKICGSVERRDEK